MTADAKSRCCTPASYLVVDDHAVFRQTVRDFLPAEAQTVNECADGGEAVAAYAAHLPDLVLMDIDMPRMDGLEATRQILSRFPAARVVILTMHDNPDMREAAGEAGAVAFLAKSNLQELPVLIANL